MLHAQYPADITDTGVRDGMIRKVLEEVHSESYLLDCSHLSFTALVLVVMSFVVRL